MKIGSKSFGLVILYFACGAYGHVPEEGKVLATLGPFAHEVQANHVHNSATSPASVGLGLLGEGDINTTGGIEVGIFYGTKTYQRNYGGSELSERVYKLSVPAGYRYWFTPVFSVGLAFDASYTMGIPLVIANNTPAGVTPTQAHNITEYGLDLAVQWEPWSKDRFAVIVDGRYFYSLTALPNEDANQYAVLVGLKYLIQAKNGSLQ